MTPSRHLRRLVAALACLICLSFGQVVAFATSRPSVLGGDVGTGPATWTARAPEAKPSVHWSDVPKDHWARDAIDQVAGENLWMRDHRQSDDGTYRFEPQGSDATRVHYDLAVDLAMPLPGVVKRRAAGLIMGSALKELKRRVEQLV